MSHFTVFVVVPKRTFELGNESIRDYIEDKLNRFDENLEIDPYIDLSKEKVWEKFEEIKKQVNETKLQDLDDYMKKYKDRINKMSTKEFWRSWDGEELDNEGNSLTTYNPESKWDWFEVGGRWEGLLGNNNFQNGSMENNSCKIKDLKEVPFAFINKSGEWFEEGKMGYWAIVSNENKSWKKDFKKLVKMENPEDYVVNLDCHI